MQTQFFLYVIIVLFIIIGFCIYKFTRPEPYRLLQNVGSFPLNISNMKRTSYNDENDDTYDGIRYKHKRPYNFLNRQNIRDIL